MIRRSVVLSAVLFSACLTPITPLAAQNAAITTDPAPNRAYPAAMEAFQIPSHGFLLNAFMYVAAGRGPHPTVILLHGFPGNERNLDLAQSIRRAGWDVLYLDYRGSWGTPGDFSFTQCIEDAGSAVAYLQNPATAAKFRSDPKSIMLVGHSMGGFVALEAAALDPTIKAVVSISAADLVAMSGGEHGANRPQGFRAEKGGPAIHGLAAILAAQGMAPLAGTSPEKLANEVRANAGRWRFANLAPKLVSRPLLVITSDDGLAAANDALVEAVRKDGGKKIAATHIVTDHSYSDHRIALQQAVLDFLARLDRKR